MKGMGGGGTNTYNNALVKKKIRSYSYYPGYLPCIHTVHISKLKKKKNPSTSNYTMEH